MSDKYIDQTGLARILTNLKANFALFNHNHSASDVNSGTLDSARLPTSGVTAGSYGPSANASPSHGGTFSVPYITLDNKGRATAASTKTITLPAAGGGGLTLTTLWTNSSPTSSFSAQTITKTHSGCKAFIIVAKGGASDDTYFQTCFPGVSRSYNISFCSTNYRFSRRVVMTYSSTSVSFAFETGNRSGTTGTSYAVPIYIYGLY